MVIIKVFTLIVFGSRMAKANHGADEPMPAGYDYPYSTSNWMDMNMTCPDGGEPCPDGSCSYYGEPCPCMYPEVSLMDYSYDAVTGWPIDTPDPECVDPADYSHLVCHGEGTLASPCQTSWGDYECVAAATHSDCPIVCGMDQVTCYATSYDGSGFPDYSQPQTVSGCASYEDGCPCNPDLEQRCVFAGWPSCYPKQVPCPLDCGDDWPCISFRYFDNGTIQHDATFAALMTESCPTNGVCECDSVHEISCSGTCQPKIYYSECPVECGSQVSCFVDNYTADGMYLSHNKVCKDSWDMCGTEEVCANGMNAKACPDAGYCTWSGSSCPVQCTEDQIECWVDDYDSMTYNQVCVPMEQSCPAPDCGTTGRQCPEFDFCIPSSDSCPLSCSMGDRVCYEIAFNADGTWNDDGTGEQVSCVAEGTPCPCGANSQSCGDDYGCIPLIYDGIPVTCPTECPEPQWPCLISDYDAVGNLLGYREKCVTTYNECPCGLNNTRCTDAYGAYCMPAWDSYSNSAFQCPLTCNWDTQQFCSIPSFSAEGYYISSVNYCESLSKPCDCSKGTRSKNCSGDCMPAAGPDTYCEPECTGDQVPCPATEEYDPNGAFLKYSPPVAADQCKATFDECPCGAGSRKCPDGFCLPDKFDCPKTCTADQEICDVVDFDKNGTVTKHTQSCLGLNTTCPCGTNSEKCPIDMWGSLIYMCLPECPCSSSEQTCDVEDYDKRGRFEKWAPKCVGLGATCPCGANAKKCVNPAYPTEFECRPKFNNEASACPTPCTAAQEEAGNKTCIKVNLDPSTLNPVSDTMTCEKTCTPGRGQKVCSHGAVIMSGYKCKDIYRVLGAFGGRRLSLQLAVGDKQTASVSFTLNELVSSPSTDSSKMKIKLDSILQLTPQLKSTLVIKLPAGTGEAKMQYTVTNQGVSSVTPKTVTSKLAEFMNKKDTSVSKVLAALGKVKMGSQGCCSSASKSKKVSAGTGTTTAAAGMTGTGTGTTTTAAGGMTGTGTTGAGMGTTGAGSSGNGTQQQAVTYTGVAKLTVTNTSRFIADMAAQNVVKASIASHANVTVSQVDPCAFSVDGGRRLSEEASVEDENVNSRQLQTTGTIRVDFTITLPATMSSSMQAAAMQGIGNMNAAALTSIITGALASANITGYNIAVQELTVSQVSTTSSSENLEDNGSVLEKIGWTTLLFLLGKFL